MKILLTFASKPWDFQDENGGKREGITVEYLLTKNLKPSILEDGDKGVRHVKESLTVDKLAQIKDVPGWYDAEFELKPGSKGKTVAVLEDLKFIAPIMESDLPFETKSTKAS